MSCNAQGDWVQYDWALKQGARSQLRITYEDNLSGYAARAQFRESFTHTATLLSISSPSNGISLTTAATVATAVLTVSATAFTALDVPKTGVWDLEFYDPLDASAVISPVRGGILIVPEVTK